MYLETRRFQKHCGDFTFLAARKVSASPTRKHEQQEKTCPIILPQYSGIAHSHPPLPIPPLFLPPFVCYCLCLSNLGLRAKEGGKPPLGRSGGGQLIAYVVVVPPPSSKLRKFSPTTTAITRTLKKMPKESESEMLTFMRVVLRK